MCRFAWKIRRVLMKSLTVKGFPGLGKKIEDNILLRIRWRESEMRTRTADDMIANSLKGGASADADHIVWHVS